MYIGKAFKLQKNIQTKAHYYEKKRGIDFPVIFVSEHSAIIEEKFRNSKFPQINNSKYIFEEPR